MRNRLPLFLIFKFQLTPYSQNHKVTGFCIQNGPLKNNRCRKNILETMKICDSTDSFVCHMSHDKGHTWYYQFILFE